MSDDKETTEVPEVPEGYVYMERVGTYVTQIPDFQFWKILSDMQSEANMIEEYLKKLSNEENALISRLKFVRQDQVMMRRRMNRLRLYEMWLRGKTRFKKWLYG